MADWRIRLPDDWYEQPSNIYRINNRNDLRMFVREHRFTKGDIRLLVEEFNKKGFVRVE